MNNDKRHADTNTTVSFRYNSLSAAAHNHEHEDAVEVAVSIEIPAMLEGEPDPSGLPFLATPVAEFDFAEPTTGRWIATGKTAFHKTGGDPGVPIAHYLDINSIEGLVGREDIIENTRPDELHLLGKIWTEGIGCDARQIWIDSEGTIRERINF